MSSLWTEIAVLVAEQVLEQDLQAERQARDVVFRLQRVDPEDLPLFAAGCQRGFGVEGVVGHVGCSSGSSFWVRLLSRTHPFRTRTPE